MRYLLERHPQHCSLHQGKCPPDVMRGAAAVIQCFGKAARKANPIAGNPVSEEKPVTDFPVPCENGLFVLFDRSDVAHGGRDPDYQLFNLRGNGFNSFQSHRKTNAVQVYIWPEETTNDTGDSRVPTTQEQLISSGKSFGLRALFDCVSQLQGEEAWWWELSRRCRMQDDRGLPVPPEAACTLECRRGSPGWRRSYPGAGEKASSPAFEAWFDAVRFQISLNMYKMGIFGTHAESFLCKVRLGTALRRPYWYSSVSTEVEGVPVVYLGDAAGSTDFKKGLSCGRGLLCAADLGLGVVDAVALQLRTVGVASLRDAFRQGARRYQLQWSSPEMKAEWMQDFDATYKYVLRGRVPDPLMLHSPPPGSHQVMQFLAQPCGAFERAFAGPSAITGQPQTA